VVLSSLSSLTPKIAIIATIGFVVILVLVLVFLPKGECARVQALGGQTVEIGCSGNQTATPPTSSPLPMQTPPTAAVPASFNIVGVWNFQGQLQAKQANGAIATYNTAGTIYFLPDGTVRTNEQIGGASTSAVATYSLQGDALTLTTQNGQTFNEQLQVIDPNTIRVYGTTGSGTNAFYTATRA
jgi:hypothetical protein